MIAGLTAARRADPASGLKLEKPYIVVSQPGCEHLKVRALLGQWAIVYLAGAEDIFYKRFSRGWVTHVPQIAFKFVADGLVFVFGYTAVWLPSFEVKVDGAQGAAVGVGAGPRPVDVLQGEEEAVGKGEEACLPGLYGSTGRLGRPRVDGLAEELWSETQGVAAFSAGCWGSA